MKASIGAKTDLTNLTGEHENPKKSDGRFLWRHISRARKLIKGENQLAEYVHGSRSPSALGSLRPARSSCRPWPPFGSRVGWDRRRNGASRR
jgi:hypothetical protein